MSTLATIQRRMQAFVLHPETPGEIATAVVATALAGVDQRLGVYAHAYRARLLEALRNDFPGLLQLTTPDVFDELGRDYIQARPSRHANLRWLGDSLADFLRTHARWSATPALADMAEFEWRLSLAFDAVTETCVEAPSLEALPATEWPNLRLVLAQSLQRMSLQWNVAAMRRALDNGEEWPAPARLDPPQPWAIWRKDLVVRHRRLDDDETAALDLVDSGGSFAELCELLCDWHALDAVAMRAVSLLKCWVGEQWIIATTSTVD